jgi:hypothetical protein
MSHRYILSSTPYLKQSGRPIYKVPSRGNLPNPYHWKPTLVQNIIQIGKEHNDMLEIIITPPQEDVAVAQEDVEPTQEPEGTIVISSIEEEVREPVKTRKIRVGNKVQIVPIE